jgi:hypothetical protein
MLLAAALGAIVWTAGCGGTHRLSKPQYEQRVTALYEEVRTAFQGTTTNIPSLQALAPRVSAAQRELRKVSSELSRLEAPKEAEEPNDAIAEGLDAYADDLDRLRQAAIAGDDKKVHAFEAGIDENESVMQIEEAAEELKSKGYNLGALTND